GKASLAGGLGVGLGEARVVVEDRCLWAGVSGSRHGFAVRAERCGAVWLVLRCGSFPTFGGVFCPVQARNRQGSTRACSCSFSQVTSFPTCPREVKGFGASSAGNLSPIPPRGAPRLLKHESPSHIVSSF